MLGNDSAFYRLYPSTAQYGGLATYQGGLWYQDKGQWIRYKSLDASDQQFCSTGCLAASIAEGAFRGSVVLGAPTTNSIKVSVFAADQSGTLYLAYGTVSGTYLLQTQPVNLVAGVPVVITLGNLDANTGYFYRVIFKASDMPDALPTSEHVFHTARPPGSAFTFTLQADSHMDENSVTSLYQRTLANVLADHPDFHIDLGDTFMTEKHSGPLSATVPPAATQSQVDERYRFERNNFAGLAQSVPLFLVNGNHEGEAGWLNTGTGDNLAIWTTKALQRYFVNPLPDGFYSGDNANEPFVGKRASWYAWQWGDALFVVLDPFWNSGKTKGNDAWALTLGDSQYHWLEQVLGGSSAKFKFIFLHNLVGGLDGQMRGGIEAAPFFEWGGKEADGVTIGFAVKRPQWSAPIHQLLVNSGVTAVFHGHDHVYVNQQLDGIVYQEVPQPAAVNTSNGATIARDYHYTSGTVVSSAGHLRVSVSANQVKVDYVRAWLPENENSQRKNGQIDHSWTLTKP